jgi:type II secretory pathway component PulF
MFKFKYRAVDANGKTIENEVEAVDRKRALELLGSKGYKVLNIVPTGKQTTGTAPAKPKDKRSKYKKSPKLALPFLKRLLQLNASGMPIGDTVKILYSRLHDGAQKELASSLWKDLSEGAGLAEAMKHNADVFSEDIIFPIEAAEATGSLNTVLKDVIRFLSERETLKKKIISGLAYPVFVSVVAIVVVALFLFFLLPRIESMLHALGGQMTLAARLLIQCSHGLIYGLPLFVVAAVVIAITISQWRKRTHVGRLTTDHWMLRIPFIGTIMRYSEICRTSNLMCTLLGSGVNLTDAMRLTEKSIKNIYLRQFFQDARSKIHDGVAFTIAFRKGQDLFFTELALDMLTASESTGDMHHGFSEIYALHNQELDEKMHFLTNAITTIALGFAFTLVGILALSIISSVLQFTKSIKLA